MLKCIRQFVQLASSLALAASTTPAQVAVFGESWPYTACTTVVNDPATGAMYVGFGSGVVVLQDTTTPPNPQLKPNVANMLRPEGLVKDLALTDDHLYVAAHRGGLVRYSRASMNPAFQWKVVDELAETWAVTVPVRVGNIDLVFAGTNDGGIGGRVFIIHASVEPGIAPDVLGSFDAEAPVYSLASMVQPNGTVVLLVGSACRMETVITPPDLQGTVPASLLRFDFPNAATTLPTSFQPITAR